MTHEAKGCRDMILLLQAELDGELGPVADEAGLTHRRACLECQAAFDLVQIARAMRLRLTRHVAPASVRRKLLHELRRERE